MNSQFTKIIRILLGLALIVFGANKFLHFIPMQPPTGEAGNFMNSLGTSGYIFPVVGVFEVVIGILLLLKKWVPFALAMLVPISINIVLFHLFLDIPGISAALLIAVLNGILIYKNWTHFKPLFT
jgi:putative oxidoreductase